MKKIIKRAAASVAAFAFSISAISNFTVFAEVTPNPVISRNCPAYSVSGQASAGNDEHYFSFWQSSSPDYLAYDLSDVPDSEKKQVIAVWYNTSTFEKIGSYANQNGLPTDYTIEVNAAAGGDYPSEGWETAETITENTLASRQHLVNMEGYNWIRINISKADGEPSRQASINFDIHNVSSGISDSWLFLGDSITAGGMNNCYGTGFATYINRIDENFFPIQENGGIGGIRSIEGKENIDRWLSVSQAKYVSIAYGTNDAWGNSGAAESYYENTKYMIDAILAAGKIPVLPKIPSSTNADVNPNVPLYNAKVDQLYEEYGDKLVHGPDFDTFFKENPEYLSSDGVHPASEGYDAMRQLWAETMYEEVYSSNTSVPEYLTGDVNADGSFNMSDIILMQKHLIGIGTLVNYDAGDVFKDGSINVFDICQMKYLITLNK